MSLFPRCGALGDRVPGVVAEVALEVLAPAGVLTTTEPVALTTIVRTLAYGRGQAGCLDCKKRPERGGRSESFQAGGLRAAGAHE